MNKRTDAEEAVWAKQFPRGYSTPAGQSIDPTALSHDDIIDLMEEHAEAAVWEERKRGLKQHSEANTILQRDLDKALALIEKQDATVDKLINSLTSTLALIDKLVNERTAPAINIPYIAPVDINPSIYWDKTWKAEVAKGWQSGSIKDNNVNTVYYYDPHAGPVPGDVTTSGWYFWDETQSHCYGPYSSAGEADMACMEYRTTL